MLSSVLSVTLYVMLPPFGSVEAPHDRVTFRDVTGSLFAGACFENAVGGTARSAQKKCQVPPSASVVSPVLSSASTCQ